MLSSLHKDLLDFYLLNYDSYREEFNIDPKMNPIDAWYDTDGLPDVVIESYKDSWHALQAKEESLTYSL